MTPPPGTTVTPKGQQRAQRFLDAALEVFTEQGFEAASVNEVVRRAGGSLATLYKLFGSKEGLFIAVIERRAMSVFEPIQDALANDLLPHDGLTRFGRRLLDFLLEPEALALYRLVLNDLHRHPELARRFLDSGPFRTLGELADYLAHQVALKRLVIDDCRLAAGEFTGMLIGDLHIQIMVGQVPTLSRAERLRRVDSAVRRFLTSA
ncbi:TetR/AcrR family transcriptional regulator [Larsenimonas suaedae]|uniref:TetR/AcrR family transcriptional regulator n=1 Tax=Larsenimonas suaedae TaxID=1851019 RepID=A0ABU1GTB9_9GAMM|nr:TetR/AcrR family transcriptional regulator [Larsenimonas suaedae]MCM2972388.1 TetR/AcrR family transcriptional regulator [Larsenimonas suaedae]MDR5894816.1 TetR/AcrR family transcriptional regulator [Larsenimonas suaedae]